MGMTDDELVEELAELAMRAYLRILDAGGGEAPARECISEVARRLDAAEWLSDEGRYDRVVDRFYELMPTDD